MLCTYVYTDLGGGKGRNGYHVIRDLAKEYISHRISISKKGKGEGGRLFFTRIEPY